MATYREIFQQMKNKSLSELRSLVDHYTAVAMRGIDGISLGYKQGNAAILTTLLAAICADGHFTRDEYFVAQPALDAFISDGITYEAALDFIRSTGIDSAKTKLAVDNFVDSLDATSKDALIFACAAICASDNNFNYSELSWLNRLIG